jgi:hypothetical protein
VLTRKDLVAEVEALANDLGQEVTTDRLNNAALTELAQQLRAKLEESTRPHARPPEPPPARPGDQVMAPPPVVHDPVRPHKPVDGAAAAEGGPPRREQRAPAPPKAPYYVAPGKSIIANGRVVSPMREVRASDFRGGQNDLDYLVMKGAVVRTG